VMVFCSKVTRHPRVLPHPGGLPGGRAAGRRFLRIANKLSMSVPKRLIHMLDLVPSLQRPVSQPPPDSGELGDL